MRRVNVDPNVKEPILHSDWLPTKWTCPLYTSINIDVLVPNCLCSNDCSVLNPLYIGSRIFHMGRHLSILPFKPWVPQSQNLP